MSARLKSIDILRGLAACAVVLYHSNSAFYLGAAGVDLFFVISGFVISVAAVGRTPSAFLLDRASRIFPLYWIALLPWVAAGLILNTISVNRLAMNALLFPRWLFETQPIMILSWTLVFELLFYTGMALSLRFRCGPAILLMYLACFVAWAMTGSGYLTWFGNPLVFEFLLGMAILRLRKFPSLGLPAIIAGVATLFLLSDAATSTEALSFSTALTRVAIWGIPAALILYGAVSLEERLTGPRAARLCSLGVASYSIYLFHKLATDLVPGPWWVKFILGVALGIGGWMLFERFFERLRRRLRKGGPIWTKRDRKATEQVVLES